VKGIGQIAVAVVIATWGVLAGCEGPSKSRVRIAYDRPAHFNISPSVRKLAVAQFGGKTAIDRRWGEVAADILASLLDEYNKRYNRYVLYDRKRLSAIMDERDVQLMIADTDTAAKVGKIADVDAMIYGNVTIITRQSTGYRKVFDPLSQKVKRQPYRKQYCLATVNFTMDNINTSRTLATVTVKRDYDSERDEEKSFMVQTLGIGGDELSPRDQIIAVLIERCVEEFLAKISPHREVIEERLWKGKTDFVKSGNRFAEAGEYADALELYLQGIKEKPDDRGAIFNAGVVCEAMGRLKEAQAYYDQAIAIKAKAPSQFIKALSRVRAEQRKGGD